MVQDILTFSMVTDVQGKLCHGTFLKTIYVPWNWLLPGCFTVLSGVQSRQVWLKPESDKKVQLTGPGNDQVFETLFGDISALTSSLSLIL